MGATIKPMSRNAIKDTYGEVRSEIVRSIVRADAVDSPNIFGSDDTGDLGDFINDAQYYRRGYIELAVPVVNTFAIGTVSRDAATDSLSKILDLKNLLYKVVNASVIYDKKLGQLLHPDSIDYETGKKADDLIYDKERYLLGGQYVRYLIDTFSFDHAIQADLFSILYEAMKGNRIVDSSAGDKLKTVSLSKVGGISEVFEIKKGSGEVWVVDDYYANFLMPIYDAEMFKKKLQTARINSVGAFLSPLALRLRVKDNKDLLYDLVPDFLMVMPIGYRPTVKRLDPLTKDYNRVIRTNNELRMAMNANNTTIYTVRQKYLELVKAIDTVQQIDKINDGKEHMPLIEKLKGKEGHIREHMLGVRSDYTGRTVITVDPYMSIDTVGIPKNMLREVLAIDMLEDSQSSTGNKTRGLLRVLKENKSNDYKIRKLLEEIPSIIGRQPTLHKLSIQSFKAVPVEGNSIVLNPLITPPFNADFDGDQMHFSIPMTPEGREEARTIMKSTNNLFHPRDGVCHVAPRHELIYGLWKASSAKSSDTSPAVFNITDNETADTLLNDVENAILDIYARGYYYGESMSAGKAAIKVALTRKYAQYAFGVSPLTLKSNSVTGKITNDKNVSEAWFKDILGKIAEEDSTKDKEVFVSIVNSLVRLGFRLAESYPPNIGVLNYPDVSDLIDEFDKVIQDREELYNEGFESDAAFSDFYTKEYNNLKKKIQVRLKESPELQSSGYLDMVAAKAHASDSNILQLFGMKGRVMKSESETFNAIIKHSLVQQLTGLEHFVTVYGSREGVMDKVIKTYKPGYISRQMGQAANFMVITNEDCGTEDGVELDYEALLQFIPAENKSERIEVNDEEVRKYFNKIVVGRYIVGRSTIITDEADATNVYNSFVSPVKAPRKTSVKLRSPMTCSNPCCVKCYGIDLSTRKPVIVGTAIGYTAAQAIGEPGTQMTMKNFQQGGVAGVKNLTNSFDTLNDYLGLFDNRKKAKHNVGGAITYDFIAPESGYIKTVSQGNGTKRLKIVQYKDNGKERNILGTSRVFVYEGVPLKEYVEAGESIQKVQGNLDMQELIKYRGIDEALRYYTLFLYNLYKEQTFVNSKHFETLVASLMFYLCLKGNEYFKTGCYYTVMEYWRHDRTGCEFEKTIKGTKDAPLYRNDVFATLMFENLKKGISRSLIMSGKDSMTLPIVRTAFGLRAGLGSDINPKYTEERASN